MSRCPRARSLVRHEIALGIRKDHIAYGFMIFDIAGATADVPIERFRNRVLEFGAFHRRLCQTLEQDLPLVQETRGAIAALERKMLDKGLLQRRKLAILRMPLDGSDGLAIKTHR